MHDHDTVRVVCCRCGGHVGAVWRAEPEWLDSRLCARCFWGPDA